MLQNKTKDKQKFSPTFNVKSYSNFIISCKVLQNKDHANWKRKIYWKQTAGLSLFCVQSATAWLKWVVGFIGGAKPWEEESLWFLIICDHQMQQIDMPG
jgi:hypothetical protein